MLKSSSVHPLKKLSWSLIFLKVKNQPIQNGHLIEKIPVSHFHHTECISTTLLKCYTVNQAWYRKNKTILVFLSLSSLK